MTVKKVSHTDRALTVTDGKCCFLCYLTGSVWILKKLPMNKGRLLFQGNAGMLPLLSHSLHIGAHRATCNVGPNSWYEHN